MTTEPIKVEVRGVKARIKPSAQLDGQFLIWSAMYGGLMDDDDWFMPNVDKIRNCRFFRSTADARAFVAKINAEWEREKAGVEIPGDADSEAWDKAPTASQPPQGETQKCPECNGLGYIGDNESGAPECDCPTCGGTGKQPPAAPDAGVREFIAAAQKLSGYVAADLSANREQVGTVWYKDMLDAVRSVTKHSPDLTRQLSEARQEVERLKAENRGVKSLAGRDEDDDRPADSAAAELVSEIHELRSQLTAAQASQKAAEERAGKLATILECKPEEIEHELRAIVVAHKTESAAFSAEKQAREAAEERAEKAEASKEFTDRWYACRIRWLEDFFRGEGRELPIAKQFWNIIANGTPDHVAPPTYQQLLNAVTHRAEAAERDLATVRQQLAEAEQRASKDISEAEANRLAAISTAALANTPVTAAASRIHQGHPCWTPAYEDVCRAVQNQMVQREAKERFKRELAAEKQLREAAEAAKAEADKRAADALHTIDEIGLALISTKLPYHGGFSFRVDTAAKATREIMSQIENNVAAELTKLRAAVVPGPETLGEGR